MDSFADVQYCINADKVGGLDPTTPRNIRMAPYDELGH